MPTASWGEKEAAATLGEAAVVLEEHPAAMQLRVLSTMAEVSAERNSTLIFRCRSSCCAWSTPCAVTASREQR
jgi:hypothetical protein